jgi:hypothetical protein
MGAGEASWSFPTVSDEWHGESQRIVARGSDGKPGSAAAEEVTPKRRPKFGRIAAGIAVLCSRFGDAGLYKPGSILRPVVLQWIGLQPC